MVNGTQDIAIARLRVLSDKRTAEACIRDLQQASWPMHFPTGFHNAWVLVRELHIKGTAQKLQRELRQQSAQQLNQLLAHAVEGRRASNSADAIYFQSLAQLLAFLLRDISLGQAAGKWYWQRWGYVLCGNREQGIVQILCEHIAELPAVVEHLAHMGQLRPLFQVISSATAQSLITQLARHFSLDSSTLLYKSTARLVKSEADLQQERGIERQLQLHPGIILHWLPVLQHLPESDQRWRLAALISGISYCPLWILHRPDIVANVFVRTLQQHASLQLVRQLAREAEVNTDNTVPIAFVSSESTRRDKQLRQLTADLPASENFSSMEIKTRPAECQSADPFQASISAPKKGLLATIFSDETLSIPEDDPLLVNKEAISDDIAMPGNAHFITQSGGFFYLINALRPLLSAEFLAAQSAASGWQWLFDCAWLLANRTGQSLDVPLLRFIASVAGCEDENSLLDAASGFLSLEAQNLFAQLEQRFDEKPFWLAGDFLACPAQVTADASHIDIFFALNSVRLDIRLAGLDINPGWVPWLGRVVTFHYVESAMDAGQGAGHA